MIHSHSGGSMHKSFFVHVGRGHQRSSNSSASCSVSQFQADLPAGAKSGRKFENPLALASGAGEASRAGDASDTCIWTASERSRDCYPSNWLQERMHFKISIDFVFARPRKVTHQRGYWKNWKNVSHSSRQEDLKYHIYFHHSIDTVSNWYH